MQQNIVSYNVLILTSYCWSLTWTVSYLTYLWEKTSNGIRNITILTGLKHTLKFITNNIASTFIWIKPKQNWNKKKSKCYFITIYNYYLYVYSNVLHLHFNFSSSRPLVSSTRPQSKSLRAIPFCVPPQALKMYCNRNCNQNWQFHLPLMQHNFTFLLNEWTYG